jgi:hypothetical protein
MRLVFVHGMRQEHKSPADLRKTWQDALIAAWKAAELATPAYTLEMPYYGDVLNDLTEAVRDSTANVVTRGEGSPNTFTPLEEALIREMASKEGISDAEIRAELGQSSTAS